MQPGTADQHRKLCKQLLTTAPCISCFTPNAAMRPPIQSAGLPAQPAPAAHGGPGSAGVCPGPAAAGASGCACVVCCPAPTVHCCYSRYRLSPMLRSHFPVPASCCPTLLSLSIARQVADRRAGKTSTAGNAGASVTARSGNPSGRWAGWRCGGSLSCSIDPASWHLCRPLEPTNRHLPMPSPPAFNLTQPRLWLARRHGHHCALAPAGRAQRPGDQLLLLVSLNAPRCWLALWGAHLLVTQHAGRGFPLHVQVCWHFYRPSGWTC